MGNEFRRNVIIVGAGASKEFGLPTGAELAAQIATIADIRFDGHVSHLISGDRQIFETLEHLSRINRGSEGISNQFLHGAWRIRDNMPLAPSIDNFLDTHRENAEVVTLGKIFITHAIQKAERHSQLFVDGRTSNPTLDFSAIKDTWLSRFFKLLVAQRTYGDFILALQKITFVSFNYDRCIHQFFYFACLSYFNLKPGDMIEVMNSLHVIFPYGSVGEFKLGGLSGTNFGEVGYRDDLISSSKQIRTFTEGTGSQLQHGIFRALQEAELTMFLGFGYLPLNMQMLLSRQVFSEPRVLGTCLGLSDDSQRELIQELYDAFPDDTERYSEDLHRIEIKNCTCWQLLVEYERYLTK